MRTRWTTLALALGLAAGACNGPEPEATPPPPPPEGVPELRLEAETLVGGLEIPWAMAFLDEDTLLVTERPGRVRVVHRGRLVNEPAAEIDVAHTGEAGLLGLALHPDFPRPPAAYLYYTYERAGILENRISRFRVQRDGAADVRLTGEEVLLDRIPGARFHDGGRIAFGPDGMLYATTGDAGEPVLAAEIESLAGKILRLTPTGDVPDDNPFEGLAVWSFGHRNPQGIAWDSEGRLWSSEHGPSGEFGGMCCLDELNRIEPGDFYGWPVRAGTVEAMDPGDPRLPADLPDPRDPVSDSGIDGTWAPAGTAVLTRDGVDNVLVANLRGRHLRRFVPDPEDPDRIAHEASALDGFGRLRAAVVGPDDCLYLATSNRDGRGDPARDDDRILRVCPR